LKNILLKQGLPFCSGLPKLLFVFLILVFLNNIKAFSQNVIGVVIADAQNLGGAVIHNTRTRELRVSDGNGRFNLNAVTGDTLVTSFIGYKNDTLSIGTQNIVTIRLKPTATFLNDVVIRGTKLSPLEQFNKNKQDYKSIYVKGDVSHMVVLSAGNGRVKTGLSIDKIYNAFSKEGRNARKLQKTLTEDYQNNVVDTRFSEKIVSEVTGYKGEELNNFIINYRPPYEFVAKASDYDIIEYIKQKEKIAEMKSK